MENANHRSVTKYGEKAGWTPVLTYWHIEDYVQWKEATIWFVPQTGLFAVYIDSGDERWTYGEFFRGFKSITFLTPDKAKEFTANLFSNKLKKEQAAALRKIREAVKSSTK